MSRKRLLAAVRDRMRAHPGPAGAGEEPSSPPVPVPSPAPRPRPRRAEPDHELEQLEAEARYARDRFDLYQARVVSGSATATSPTRLRELERTSTAAAERLAHARRARRADG
jgi:hypothetical protein